MLFTEKVLTEKYKVQYFLYLLILVLCFLSYTGINKILQRSELKSSNLELTDAHNRSTQIIHNSVNVFGAIASGLQGYVNSAETFPTALELQNFVNIQLTNVKYNAPIAVSFIDTSHNFVYSFTRDSIDPYNLVGTSVTALRNSEEIGELNQLFKTEELKMYPPINLLEGWVGIPVNFRVKRKGKVLGYIAAIVQFKSLAKSLYTSEVSDKFIYKFSINGVTFDREEVYDGSKKYNHLTDSKSYKNHAIDSSKYLYSTLPLFGQKLSIGTGLNSSKDKYSSKTSQLILALFFLSFALFSILLVRQFYKKKQLLNLTQGINDQIHISQSIIQEQNVELSSLNATKDRFFSIIAHDLRAPLGSLTGLVELIQEDTSLEDGLRDLMSKLKSATVSAADLLDSLLKWSMSQTGDIPYRPEQLAVQEILSSTLELVGPSAFNKKIEIKKDLDIKTTVFADKNMLSTVLRNLISNAIKFTNTNGVILISAQQTETKTQITIKDNGVGMTESQVSSIFSLENNSTKKGTAGELGTGLGLLVCKEFIAKHNGDLSVKSAIDRGTTFFITLPNP